jgi:hypothetical protein
MTTDNNGGRTRSLMSLGILSTGSLVLAVAQSVCTAVLTIGALRVAIGVSALAAGSIFGPLHAFHRSWIRVPMLIAATAGAVLNLLVLSWIWYLRSRPSAQWRKREISQKEKQSERLQVALAILTLVLVALEAWAHPILNHGASAF